MKIITSNDIIFVRASFMGREIFNIRLSGIPSKEALMRRLKEELGNFFGMVVLSIRNLTQGWSHSSAYVVQPA